MIRRIGDRRATSLDAVIGCARFGMIRGEITNIGDTPLAAFTLRDAVLGVQLDDLIVVWGDPNGILEPGQSLVLAHEMTVERNLRTECPVSVGDQRILLIVRTRGPQHDQPDDDHHVGQ